MENIDQSALKMSVKHRVGNKSAGSLLIIILFTALSAIPFTSCNLLLNQESQENRRIRATQRNISREKEKREAEYRKQTDRQYQMQDKATRKRMKELERKSKRWRDNKPEPFYKRWYYQWIERGENRRQNRNE